MSQTNLEKLAEYGQSIWLDYINRSMLESDKLKNMIAKGLRGMTSNPSIFNQAISTSNDYDNKILKLKGEGKSTFQIYDELTVQDIQDAADHFKGVFQKTNKLDGYVSLEINPQLANKVNESIEEGIRLFKKVNRPNVMIKVPATPEGFPVVEELLANEINVNATLIFSQKQYEETVKAYFRGLNRLASKVNDLSNARSVASVFVSRIDTHIDKILDEKTANESNETIKEKLQMLKGKAAVANSRIIFNKFQKLFSSEEFKALEVKNANIQRVLWASTSTKSQSYSNVKYVTELIAKPTVNTLPEKTLEAFLKYEEDFGSFDDEIIASENAVSSLREHDIIVNDVCQKLLEVGVTAFDKAFESLFESIEQKAEQLTLTS